MPQAAKGAAGRRGNGRKKRDADGRGNFFICTWGYVSEKYYKGHNLRKEIWDGTS